MMRNILLITCFLFSFSVFSQEAEIVKNDTTVPTSIFAVNSLKYQQNNLKVSPLHLTGYKFMIVDFFNSNISYNSLHFDLRNIGRDVSFEDITDNYNKAKLNTYDVSRNNDHFIWTMWDTRLQKQWQQDLQKAKN